jgi:hypothetical protein
VAVLFMVNAPAPARAKPDTDEARNFEILMNRSPGDELGLFGLAGGEID